MCANGVHHNQEEGEPCDQQAIIHHGHCRVSEDREADKSDDSGVATGWNLGVVVAGGTAPYVSVGLIEATGNVLSPAFFVITAAAFGLAAIAGISAGGRPTACRHVNWVGRRI